MIVNEDGSIYVEKGELFPYRCPCGAYIQTAEEEFDCTSCGRHLFAEDLKDQQAWQYRTLQ